MSEDALPTSTGPQHRTLRARLRPKVSRGGHLLGIPWGYGRLLFYTVGGFVGLSGLFTDWTWTWMVWAVGLVLSALWDLVHLVFLGGPGRPWWTVPAPIGSGQASPQSWTLNFLLSTFVILLTSISTNARGPLPQVAVIGWVALAITLIPPLMRKITGQGYRRTSIEFGWMVTTPSPDVVRVEKTSTNRTPPRRSRSNPRRKRKMRRN